MRSRAVERLARFLFGMELVLRPVKNAAQLDRVNWAGVKVLQLQSEDVDISIGLRRSLLEPRRVASW